MFILCLLFWLWYWDAKTSVGDMFCLEAIFQNKLLSILIVGVTILSGASFELLIQWHNKNHGFISIQTHRRFLIQNNKERRVIHISNDSIHSCRLQTFCVCVSQSTWSFIVWISYQNESDGTLDLMKNEMKKSHILQNQPKMLLKWHNFFCDKSLFRNGSSEHKCYVRHPCVRLGQSKDHCAHVTMPFWLLYSFCSKAFPFHRTIDIKLS